MWVASLVCSAAIADVILSRVQPLRSNIPLHSFRANLKEGTGYVTSFPYGGLSPSSSLSLFPASLC